MNSDDLALFALVAKSGSLSKAALEQGTNQSTVSRRIGLLEATLAVRLFHRSGRGVELTDRGQQLLSYANTIHDTLAEAVRTIRDSSELGPARLCIAAQPTIARMLFAQIGLALKARYPLMQVQFVEALASDVLNRLGEGTVDIAVLYIPEQHGTLLSEPLLTEGVQLIAPADYPLEGDTIAVRDLGDIPLILPSTHHGLRMLLESLATRYGFSPNIALECDGSISITKRLVLEHCGCTLLPTAAVIDELQTGLLKSYKIEEAQLRRTVAIVWPRNRIIAHGLSVVTRIIRERTTHLVESGAWPGTERITNRNTNTSITD